MPGELNASAHDRRPPHRSGAGVTSCAAAGAAAIVLLAACGAPFPARALEWRQTPQVEAAAGYDGNINLDPTFGRSVGSAALTAQTNVVGRSERLRLHFSPRLRSLQYNDSRELDRTDTYADFGMEVTGERQRWSLGGGYAREGTLTTEFEGSGFVQTGIDRVQRLWNGQWSRAQGERGRYELSASAVSVDYQEALFSPLVDYGYRVFEAAYSLNSSERGSWRFSLSRAEVRAAAVNAETASTELRATWTRALSSVLSASFGIGAFQVDQQRPFGARASSGSLDLSLNRRWARWTLDASVRREMRPDGRGALVRQDRMELRSTRRLSSRTAFEASLVAARLAPESRSSFVVGRDYGQAALEIRRRLSQTVAISWSIFGRSQAYQSWPKARGLGGEFAVKYRGR